MVQKTASDENARALERKHEILEAASRAFRESGFHATGMRDIANALGMTVGNLYYYFNNKQELLAFCQDETVSRLLRLADWVREQQLRADARLFLLIVGHAQCLNEGTPGSLAHIEIDALDRPWRQRITERRDRFEQVVRDVIQSGIDGGVFRDQDAKVAAFCVLGALNWTVKWYRPEGPRTAQNIGEQFAAHLVRGLLLPGFELEKPEIEIPDL